MSGLVQALWRHPVKGFTSEPLAAVALRSGEAFPGDRLFAVEDGPSGFDPDNPRHLSKMKFAVLAKIPEVARVRTRFDDATSELTVEVPGRAPFRAVLSQSLGREAFAAWLADTLGEAASGPLRVLTAPEGHRFMDDRAGFVSIINAESLRALEGATGRAVSPLRFRANVVAEGWPAWAENKAVGARLRLGEAVCHITKPIGRCRATHVSPDTGEDDMDLVSLLHAHFGHTVFGVYLSVETGGRVAVGDPAEILP